MQIDISKMNGVKVNEIFEDGSVKSCVISGYNCLRTAFGPMVPQFTEEFSHFSRKKKLRPSMIFHRNGSVKSLALDEQMDIKTPLGTFGAELVTFYDDGNLNRVFPLNGAIDGYWSQEEEGALALTHDFDLSVGKVSAKLVSLRFCKDGNLKSLTFWPGSDVSIMTPVGELICRNGLSLYEDGSLKSTEPSKMTNIDTPIGKVLAYDPNAIGLHADTGSLTFSREGQLRTVTTNINTFRIQERDGIITVIEPREIESFVEDSDVELVPVSITFTDERVHFYNGEHYEYRLSDIQLTIGITSNCGGGCSDCTSCH